MTSDLNAKGIRSRWLLTVLGLGAALGYSNLLDFPVMVGLHGGSAYLLVFFVCQMFIALPVMLSELFLGRRSRTDAFTGWRDLSVGRVIGSSWRFVGAAMLVAGLFTVAAYSVLFSWSAIYLQAFWAGTLTQDADFVRYFLSVIHQTDTIALVQFGFFGVLSLLLLLGFRFGLVPVLFLMVSAILIALVTNVALVNGFDYGGIPLALDRVFGWRPEAINQAVFFGILNQAFFSLGIGVGALWIAGSFAHPKASLGKVVLLVMAFDLIASLLAAVTLWQLNLQVTGDRWSVTEVLFQQLPSLMDSRAIMVFFAAMVLTGVTSTLLIMENLIRAVSNRFALTRFTAVLLVVTVTLGFGVAGQMSFNRWHAVMWYGRSLFDNYVVLSSGVLVPITGALLAVFVGWVMRSADARDEWQPTRIWRFWAWRWSLRIVSIVAILLVFFGALDQQFGLDMQDSLVAIGLVVFSVLGLRAVMNLSR